MTAQVDIRRARVQQRPLTPSSTLDRPHPRTQLRKHTERSSWVDAAPWSSPSSSPRKSPETNPSSTDVNLPYERRHPTRSRFSKLPDSIIPQSTFFSDRDFDMVWRELEGESVPVLIKRERWRDVLGHRDSAAKVGRLEEHTHSVPLRRDYHACKHHLHTSGVTGLNRDAKARYIQANTHTHTHTQDHNGGQGDTGFGTTQAAYDSPLESRKLAVLSKATSFLSAMIYKAIFWKSRDLANRNVSGKRKHQFPRPWTKVDPNAPGFPGTGTCDLDPEIDKTANLNTGHGHGGFGHTH